MSLDFAVSYHLQFPHLLHQVLSGSSNECIRMIGYIQEILAQEEKEKRGNQVWLIIKA
jgi:hypothetical protein